MYSLWLAALLVAAPPSGTAGFSNAQDSGNQPSAENAAETGSTYTALDLRNEIRSAFRTEAETRNKPDQQEEHLSSVMHLISLYQVLQTNTPMTEAETISMTSMVRSRLHRIATDLRQDLRRAELEEKSARYRARRNSPDSTYSPESPSYSHPSTDEPALIDLTKSDTGPVKETRPGLELPIHTVLFQIGAALGQQDGAEEAGEALIEVIKGATGRQKWDDQGGPGSIRLFKAGSLMKPLIEPLRQAGVNVMAGALGGNAVDDHGPELVELIETVIVPNSWEKNGGFGSIIYYAPLRVIVVRTTGDIHGNVGNVIGNLRAAGN